jgi:DUF2950 family protein
MKPQLFKTSPRTVLLVLLVAALSLALVAWGQNRAQTQAQPQAQHEAAPPAENQRGFATPQLAAEALIKAAQTDDVPALLEILGPDGKDLVASADPVRDKTTTGQFAEKASQKHFVSVEKNTATLQIGNEGWPMPIPIVKREGKWYFDTKAGREEILYRRIGANELDAIQICRGYVEAQKQYALIAHGNPPLHQYAQKIISTPGKQDGLFWRNEDGSPGGPISEGIARALEEGYSSKGPYHGYYFKILQGQGPNAPFGKIEYNVNGVTLGGFALIAVPADYRVTGVKTFMVSHWGVVYEKDLGPDSLKIAKEMTEFNPDKTWRPTREKLLLSRR